MNEKLLLTFESDKSIEEIIENLKAKAPDYGFKVRLVMDLGSEYQANGAEVEDGFQIFQVIVCSFTRSYQAVKKNPERAAVLLPPKQMVLYNKNGKTIVNYLPFTHDYIARALPEDDEFPDRLARACQKIAKLIEASV
jgi:uncharacterized protein (DUF302 family)